MSWDAVIVKEKFDLEDENYEPKALGKRDEIIKLLKKILPNLDESGEFLEEYGYSIEFRIDEDEIIDTISLSARGGGNPLNAIKLILMEMNWNAIDCQTGEFIDVCKQDTKSWEDFQEYRDKITNNK